MKRIVAKGEAANSINTLTRVLLVDDESDVNATLREELEQNEVKVDSIISVYKLGVNSVDSRTNCVIALTIYSKNGCSEWYYRKI
jgi:DNA-binding NtrC family response regulator